MKKIKALRDNAFVLPDGETTTTESGIILTGSIADSSMKFGTVVDHGDGYENKKGGKINPPVKVGDRVCYKPLSGACKLNTQHGEINVIPFHMIECVIEQ